VLQAIGRTKELAEASLRIGIGRNTTKDNIDYAVNKISSVVKNLREIESLKSDLL
jgi:cysteine desulfurase